MKSSLIAHEAREVLVQLVDLINQLTIDEYNQKINFLSNYTIGEHTRHIVELFQQLFLGYEVEVINYDDRKRDIRIQENIDFATKSITKIIRNINRVDKKINLITIYNNQKNVIETSYYRELLYNIEHCIHHQAIIKIGLHYLNRQIVDKTFGFSKSTLAYKNQCVL